MFNGNDMFLFIKMVNQPKIRIYAFRIKLKIMSLLCIRLEKSSNYHSITKAYQMLC